MFILDPGSEFFSIPDPGSKRSQSRICIKEFKYLVVLYFKNFLLSSRRYHLGWDVHVHPVSGFLSIPDPGSGFRTQRGKKAPNPGSWIRILNTGSKAKRWFAYLERWMDTFDKLVMGLAVKACLLTGFELRTSTYLERHEMQTEAKEHGQHTLATKKYF
jgi:hypothetical protein